MGLVGGLCVIEAKTSFMVRLELEIMNLRADEEQSLGECQRAARLGA